MKTLKIILLVVAFGAAIYYTEAKAQTQFDYLGGFPISANVTGCFYIDLNTGNTNLGINDVVITHGNGEIYFTAVSGDSMRAPGTTNYLRKNLWQDCDERVNVYDQNKIYIKTTYSSLNNGSHVLPFKYNNLYNYIVIRVSNDSIFIRGWKFNMHVDLFECYLLTMPDVKRTEPIKKEE